MSAGFDARYTPTRMPVEVGDLVTATPDGGTVRYGRVLGLTIDGTRARVRWSNMTTDFLPTSELEVFVKQPIIDTVHDFSDARDEPIRYQTG